MHEWALADAVVKAAVKCARGAGVKKIDSVTVVLGELQNIDPKAFKFLFNEIKLSAPPSVKSAKLKIKKDAAVFSCLSCGAQFEKKECLEKLGHKESEAVHFIPETAKIYIKCPKCKNRDFKIIKGRGVYLAEITGEK
ncbi:MAG: hydrogenase nickel incorporation protein HypA [Elusimicrobia bacterium]|nr:hydrogenase nickel incorporation protein HypA [Elusimicrobiota bacterium]